VAASAVPEKERVRLISAVRPVAAQDVTHLDWVLGLLLCLHADVDGDETPIEAELHRQTPIEPTGVWAEIAP
jgi:hypothetical protein